MLQHSVPLFASNLCKKFLEGLNSNFWEVDIQYTINSHTFCMSPLGGERILLRKKWKKITKNVINRMSLMMATICCYKRHCINQPASGFLEGSSANKHFIYSVQSDSASRAGCIILRMVNVYFNCQIGGERSNKWSHCEDGQQFC